MAIENVVLYHANCMDGFCAAWVASQFLPREKTEFVPVQYGQSIPSEWSGKYVYIVDFCYSADQIRYLLKNNRFVAVIDHHKTSAPILDELKKDGNEKLDVLFDLTESGGSLTHQYFNDNTEYHWLVTYTKDRDLWLFVQPDSRAINAYLRVLPMSFDVWDNLANDTSQDLGFLWNSMIGQGNAIIKSQDQTIEQHTKKAVQIRIDGHKIRAVNATTLFSEIAGKLSEGFPFAAAYFIREDNKVQWSLRSARDGLDVSEIAKKHGGGGHKHAAGFETDIQFLKDALEGSENA